MATMNTGLGGAAGYGENAFSTTPLTAGNYDDGSINVNITSVFGGSGLNFFGTNYTSIYINTNGLITFTGPNTAYSPVGIASYNSPAMAPFWSDVDINKGGEIYWDLDPAAGTVTITWDGVAPYSGSGTNSFQVVLTSTGSGDFLVEYIYEDIQWTNGYAGNATTGMTDGGSNDYVLPGSGNAASLTNYDTNDHGDDDPAGTWEMGMSGGSAVSNNYIVEGTSGDDLIDASYVGDPEGDNVDNSDHSDGSNDDSIVAGAGADTVLAAAGDDTVLGGTGADSLDGGAGDDTLDGGSDNDTLIGGLGSDTLTGGTGNDTLTIAEGDVATGGDGEDLFLLADYAEPGSTTITIDGGTTGEPGGDTLDLNGLADRGTLVTTASVGDADAFDGTITLNDGTVLTFSNIENIICFTPGTMIATPSGEQAVETLKAGDLVLTKDSGAQPLGWVGSSTVSGMGKFAPIRLEPSLTGARRALTVSPQHRMLQNHWLAELMFEEAEVLVPAVHMLGHAGAEAAPAEQVTYIHLMFDAHEIIFAEGAETESFHYSTESLKALHPAALAEVYAAYPALKAVPSAHGPTARRCLKSWESQALLSKVYAPASAARAQLQVA